MKGKKLEVFSWSTFGTQMCQRKCPLAARFFFFFWGGREGEVVSDS